MARTKGSKNKPKKAMAPPAGVPARAEPQNIDTWKGLRGSKKQMMAQAEIMRAGMEAVKKIVGAASKSSDDLFLEQLIKDTGNEQTARAIFNALKATASMIGTNIKFMIAMDSEIMQKLMLEAFKNKSKRSCLDCRFKNFCTIYKGQTTDIKSEDRTYPGKHAFDPTEVATICNLFTKDELPPALSLPHSGSSIY